MSQFEMICAVFIFLLCGSFGAMMTFIYFQNKAFQQQANEHEEILQEIQASFLDAKNELEDATGKTQSFSDDLQKLGSRVTQLEMRTTGKR